VTSLERSRVARWGCGLRIAACPCHYAAKKPPIEVAF
jgi:hypothetical protein